MRGRIILGFVSGIVVTLILVGMGWYFRNAFRSEPSHADMSMKRMAGMEREGMKMDGTGEQSSASGGGIAQAAVMMSPARRQLIGVKTEMIEEQPLENVIRTVGTVDYDERRIRHINLRVSRRITDLLVDYTGKYVKKGDPLFTLYSPDLVSTQEEYLLAKRTLERVQASPVVHVRTGAEAQVASARNRLLLWNLTEEQIGELEERGKPQKETIIYSPIDGVVTKKMALQGMYVTPEMNLYEIADLSTVWVYADIYE